LSLDNLSIGGAPRTAVRLAATANAVNEDDEEDIGFEVF
jgi:hypothetical protein